MLQDLLLVLAWSGLGVVLPFVLLWCGGGWVVRQLRRRHEQA